MLESLLAVSGLVLLRGEGHKHKGFGVGLKGLKWEGRTMGHRLGMEVRRVLVGRKVSVLTLFIRPSLSSDSVQWEGRSLLKALIKKSVLW